MKNAEFLFSLSHFYTSRTFPPRLVPNKFWRKMFFVNTQTNDPKRRSGSADD